MSERYLLLVEGKDDEHVFYHLLEHYRMPERFAIKNYEGISKLVASLPVRLKASDLERLGIVVDANTSLDARWQSLQDILIRAGYRNVPRSPQAEGTIIRYENKPVVGIWLMPDNRLPGTLEDFCGFLVPPGDPLWDRAGQCLEQMPENERRFPPARRSKALIHTWLAWQAEPGKPLGTAITARYLDADAPHALQLMQWLRRLFDL